MISVEYDGGSDDDDRTATTTAATATAAASIAGCDEYNIGHYSDNLPALEHPSPPSRTRSINQQFSSCQW